MSEIWYSLDSFTCPAQGCDSRKKVNWTCVSDGTKTFIAQTGYIRCDTWEHNDRMCTWGWDCGSHGDHPVDKYRKADAQGFGFAMSQAVSFLNEAGSTWVAALVNEVGEQFNRK